MMRRAILVCVVASLAASCAYQGTVVQKEVRSLPFSDSLGLPATYAFLLRDSGGEIHRQLVSAEVFTGFQVGDYFDDWQPGLPNENNEMAAPAEGPETLPPVPRYDPTERYQIPFQPIRTVDAPAASSPGAKHHSVVRLTRAAHRKNAKSPIVKAKSSARKVAQKRKKHSKTSA